MITKRVLALALVLPLLAGGAFAPNPAEAGGLRSAAWKASTATADAPGWASDVSSRRDNRVIHQYHGGPKSIH